MCRSTPQYRTASYRLVLHGPIAVRSISSIGIRMVYDATLNGMIPCFTGTNGNDAMVAHHCSSGVREEHGEGSHRHGRGRAHDQGPRHLRTRLERYGGPVPHDRALHGRDQGQSIMFYFFSVICSSITVFV